MQPAVPVGGNLRRLSIATVDHVAAPALVVAFLVGAALIITVAELVGSHEVRIAGDREQGADRGAVPPGEDHLEHALDRLGLKVVSRRGL